MGEGGVLDYDSGARILLSLASTVRDRGPSLFPVLPSQAPLLPSLLASHL